MIVPAGAVNSAGKDGGLADQYCFSCCQPGQVSCSGYEGCGDLGLNYEPAAELCELKLGSGESLLLLGSIICTRGLLRRLFSDADGKVVRTTGKQGRDNQTVPGVNFLWLLWHDCPNGPCVRDFGILHGIQAN